MSDYHPHRGAASAPAHLPVQVDEGLRTYMLGVYNNMAVGLGLTALMAWITFSASFVATPEGLALTSLGAALFGSPLRWVIILAPLGMVIFLSMRIHKMNPDTAKFVFFFYSALVGLSLASIFALYTATSITRVFLITAIMFGSLSLYGYTTKRDLSAWGAFFFMGLIGLIVAMVVNWFLASSALSFAISVMGVLIFAGLTVYDTQRIKGIYYASDSTAVAGRKSVMGALVLYLDFLNMFLFMLQLLGSRR